MRSTTSARRLGPAAAITLLLALGAACSPDPVAEPSPTPAVTSPAISQTSAPPATSSSPPSRSTVAPSATAPPTVSQRPPATTPVPPPTPGDVTSSVEAKPEESKKPVKLDKPSKTGTGLTAKLTMIKAIDAKAQLPGEIAGPALALTVEVTNTGAKTADLSAVVVTVLDSDEAPGGEMTSDPAKPLKGKLGAGKTARGVYVFTVDKSKRNPVTVTVSISDAPVLVFNGKAD